MKPVRYTTNLLHQLMDEGVLDARAVADAAIQWMSEHDVTQMAHDNELILDNDDEDEDLEDEEEE